MTLRSGIVAALILVAGCSSPPARMAALPELAPVVAPATQPEVRPADPKLDAMVHLDCVDPATVNPFRCVIVTLFADRCERNNGNIIVPAGMDVSDYRRNPLVVYQHDITSSAEIVGRTVWIEITNEYARACIEFMPKPAGWEGNWTADLLLACFQFGIGGVSVRVDILEQRPADLADRLIHGMRTRTICTRTSLTEISWVWVGAFAESVPEGR